MGWQVTVIGTINRDTIIFPDGRKFEGYGGILYNIVTLAALMGEQDKVIPVCLLGDDIYDGVTDYLSQHKNVCLDGIRKFDGPNNNVTLYYQSDEEKPEILKKHLPPIPFDQIEPWLESDFVLVNFTSGFDITVETMGRIRQASPALMLMDVHSLSLDVDSEGKRFLRRITDWGKWTRGVDFVQCNWDELRAVIGKRNISDDDIVKMAQELFSGGTKALLVTQGERGVRVLWSEGEKPKVQDVLSPKTEGVVNTVGCGDVFTSSFIIKYMESKDLLASAQFAVQLAAVKSRFNGFEYLGEIQPLKAVN